MVNTLVPTHYVVVSLLEYERSQCRESSSVHGTWACYMGLTTHSFKCCWEGHSYGGRAQTLCMMSTMYFNERSQVGMSIVLRLVKVSNVCLVVRIDLVH